MTLSTRIVTPTYSYRQFDPTSGWILFTTGEGLEIADNPRPRNTNGPERDWSPLPGTRPHRGSTQDRGVLPSGGKLHQPKTTWLAAYVYIAAVKYGNAVHSLSGFTRFHFLWDQTCPRITILVSRSQGFIVKVE